MGKAMTLRVGCAAGLLMGLGLALATGTAEARVSTNLPGSILIFPKVINQGTQDTVLQVTNTSNLTRHVRCFYIDGSAGPDGRPRWQVTDFNLSLTRQQPTHWLGSQGRSIHPVDDDLSEAGLDPGSIPPLPPGFTGSLMCVEVDESGTPSGGDSLKGEATVGGLGAASASSGGAVTCNQCNCVDDQTVCFEGEQPLGLCSILCIPHGGLDGAQDYPGTPCTDRPLCPLLSTGSTGISKYNGIAIPAGTTGPDNGDTTANELLLNDAEYSGCPLGAHLNFAGEGAVDLFDAPITSVVSSTNLTFVPCEADIERLIPTRVGLFFDIRNEFEQTLSTSTTIECWGSFSLSDIIGVPIDATLLGSNYGYALITSTAPPGQAPEPFVGVANVLRSDAAGNLSTAATNLHFYNNTAATNSDNAVIRLSDQ